MPRPLKYTDKLATKICDQIAEGMTIRTICHDVNMPSATTLHQWQAQNARFLEQYLYAREASADFFEAQILEAIANTTPENARATQVKIAALFKIMAQRNPKRYGDKQQLEHTSPDGSMSQHPRITVTFIEPDLKKASS